MISSTAAAITEIAVTNPLAGSVGGSSAQRQHDPVARHAVTVEPVDVAPRWGIAKPAPTVCQWCHASRSGRSPTNAAKRVRQRPYGRRQMYEARAPPGVRGRWLLGPAGRLTAAPRA
jgi:hypothetical protein